MKDIAVTVAAPQVTLTDGRGTITVTVVNSEPTTEHVVVTALGGGGTGPSGVPPTTTVDRPLRDVAPGQTEQFVARIDATSATAGLHTVRFVAAPSDEATEEYADRAAGTTVVVAERAAVVTPPRRFPWWVVAVIALVTVVVVVFVVVRSHAGTPTPVTPTTTTSTAAGTPVPAVVGSSQGVATARLTAAGFTQVSIARDHRATGSTPGTVIAVSPAEGVLASTQNVVTLTVAAPNVVPTVPVPDVVGLPYAAAASRLAVAGLVPAPGGQCVSGTAFCIVDSALPVVGTPVPRGQTILLVGHLTKFG